MKVINRIIFAFTLLCFLTGCNDKEVNNVEPIDTIVIDNHIEENSPNGDILVNNDYDTSSIENQIKTIVECTPKSTVNSIKYYTIADLDNNGRMELLWSKGENAVEVLEVSEDYLSLQKIGTMPMFVSGEGEMTLKRYEIEEEYIYVGYNSYGRKIIYFKDNEGIFSSKTLYGENNSRILYEDGENGLLVSCESDYLSESKKVEDDYFADATSKQTIILNWYEIEGYLEDTLLLELNDKIVIKDYVDIDESDSLCAFTGNRVFLWTSKI